MTPPRRRGIRVGQAPQSLLFAPAASARRRGPRTRQRGRVGRGAAQSHCLLLYQPPLSELSRERLRIVRESNDGFLIAEEDLRLRGPGQMLGTRQTGLMSFKVADISRDSDMLEQVRDSCDELLNSHPAVAEPLIRRWLGESSHYADV